ncbi:MAG TPA: bifunctional hydroxymethylpyrimidine kinase/phosphomethylpyrimidine kinase [Candidatus Binataceae bacterium]|nr:bifunctional hydroxymethylpyrimidine kinase/phosphomethylpyrimidine kinase [Candidatus Binataceae bacterium]
MRPRSSTLSAIPVAMTIAGSDPGGGAGLQADLKTFAAFGVHGYSVVTAIIAQSSARVVRVAPVAPAMLTAQIEVLAAECRPAAIKTGALATAGNVRAVAAAIALLGLPAPIVDPVMIASSGARLLDRAGEAQLRLRLLPLARVCTPNLPEAERLSGLAIDSPAAMRAAARAICALGARAVVIKGGHEIAGRRGAPSARVIDLLYDGRDFIEMTAARIPGGGAHGTGCAFAAAIAAMLACGADLEAAVRAAKAFVTRALRRSYLLGPRGRPILGHLPRR